MGLAGRRVSVHEHAQRARARVRVVDGLALAAWCVPTDDATAPNTTTSTRGDRLEALLPPPPLLTTATTMRASGGRERRRCRSNHVHQQGLGRCGVRSRPPALGRRANGRRCKSSKEMTTIVFGHRVRCSWGKVLAQSVAEPWLQWRRDLWCASPTAQARPAPPPPAPACSQGGQK